MLHLFDVDGTLIRSFMREGARRRYDDVVLLPGRLQKLGVLEAPNARFGIVTNQAGVAMGYQTQEQVYTKMSRLLGILQFFGGYPTSVHICVDHPDARIPAYRKDDGRRKPGPGMLLEAMALHGNEPSDTLFVGDHDTDEQAAAAAGCLYIDAEAFFGCPEGTS